MLEVNMPQSKKLEMLLRKESVNPNQYEDHLQQRGAYSMKNYLKLILIRLTTQPSQEGTRQQRVDELLRFINQYA